MEAAAHDRVNLIPAFAARLAADPTLDREHDAFVWLPASPGPSNAACSFSPTASSAKASRPNSS